MNHAPERRRLLLVVIDGLGSAPLQRALQAGHAPTLQAVLDAGARYDDATSPFPSLTPVCLSTIITGVGPDLHRIPSLSWFHRGERRFVEYGSSFSAAAIEGTARTIEDVMLNLNHVHLAEEPRTLFEVLQDGGRTAASVNYMVYRGRTRHTMKHDYGPIAALGKRAKVHSMYGPDHFYMGELFGSVRPVLPQVGIKRPRDWGAAHIARWLLRNTASDFVLLYLGQHDVASHKSGPEETQRAIRVADRAMARVIAGMGGLDRFLEECALVLCADHGQTNVYAGQSARVEEVFDDVELFRGSRTSDVDRCELAVSPSNRCAMVYRIHHDSPPSRWVASRALESPAAELAAFAEDGHLTVLRDDGRELRVVRDPDRGTPTARGRSLDDDHDRWRLEGDLDALDIGIEEGLVHYGGEFPDALARLDQAVRCINSGDVLLSGREGWEFVDIGGSTHSGGSHGSLRVGDSVAPLVTFGLDEPATRLDQLVSPRLSDISSLVRGHFGL